jgi:hypothetical protein
MIDPEKWYSVDAVAAHWNVGRDTVIRRIAQGFVKAFVIPCKSSVRKRCYEVRRIKGSEVLRIEREHTA